MSNQQQHGMQINPQEVAAAALTFLARSDFRKAERPMFDAVDAMLTAIVQGTVVLANPPQAQKDATEAAPIEATRRRRARTNGANGAHGADASMITGTP